MTNTNIEETVRKQSEIAKATAQVVAQSKSHLTSLETKVDAIGGLAATTQDAVQDVSHQLSENGVKLKEIAELCPDIHNQAERAAITIEDNKTQMQIQADVIDGLAQDAKQASQIVGKHNQDISKSLENIHQTYLDNQASLGKRIDDVVDLVKSVDCNAHCERIEQQLSSVEADVASENEAIEAEHNRIKKALDTIEALENKIVETLDQQSERLLAISDTVTQYTAAVDAIEANVDTIKINQHTSSIEDVEKMFRTFKKYIKAEGLPEEEPVDEPKPETVEDLDEAESDVTEETKPETVEDTDETNDETKPEEVKPTKHKKLFGLFG